MMMNDDVSASSLPLSAEDEKMDSKENWNSDTN